jgi:TalC/MipB family fructose-6-phosphate aldolase
MEIWLDTTKQACVTEASRMGLLHGVTTNPKLIAQSDASLDEIIPGLLAIQPGPVAVQVLADETLGMIEQGKKLHAYSSRIIVKIMATAKGFEAMHGLNRLNIPVMATAIFEPFQALLAWKAGASYAAPYLGRIADQGGDPLAVLQSMRQMKEFYGFKGKILAAGIRHSDLLKACAETGICAITIPDMVWKNILQGSEGTRKSIGEFSLAWQSSKHLGKNDLWF